MYGRKTPRCQSILTISVSNYIIFKNQTKVKRKTQKNDDDYIGSDKRYR